MGSGLEDIRIPDDGDAPNKRALVIAAHPDDSEFGVAGTVALWARDGWEVYYLICTRRLQGHRGPGDDAGEAGAHAARGAARRRAACWA